MTYTPSFLSAFVLGAFLTGPVAAGPVQWVETDGARIGLALAGEPEADGTLRGALIVELEEGWKTYWMDPGEAGVPPSVTLAGAAGMADPWVGFPAPDRIDDAYSSWAGYDEDVAFALSFDMDGRTDPMRADIFLGVCETICIPVQASFSVDPVSTSSDAESARLVREAFAALPQPDSADFGVEGAVIEGDALRVEAMLPSGWSGPASLFLAGDGSYGFGMAEEIGRKGQRVVFSVPVHDRHGEESYEARYVLATDAGAVEGTFQAGR